MKHTSFTVGIGAILLSLGLIILSHSQRVNALTLEPSNDSIDNIELQTSQSVTIQGTILIEALEQDSDTFYPVTIEASNIQFSIYHIDSYGPILLSNGATDLNGNYSIIVPMIDPMGLNLYFELRTTTPRALIVSDEWQNPYTHITSILASQVTQENLTLNYTIPEEDNTAQPFYVAYMIEKGYSFLADLNLWPNPMQVEVKHNWNCLTVFIGDSCYPGLGLIYLAPSHNRYPDIILHEYGHFVHAQQIGDLPIITACASIGFSHQLFAPSSVTCAWVEGWAHFFQMAVQNDHDYIGNDLENVNEKLLTITEAPELYEFIVAAMLWDIFDNNPDYHAGYITQTFDAINDGFNGAQNNGIWHITTQVSTPPSTLFQFFDIWYTSRGVDPISRCDVAQLFTYYQIPRTFSLTFVTEPYFNVPTSSGPICADGQVAQDEEISFYISSLANTSYNYIIWQSNQAHIQNPFENPVVFTTLENTVLIAKLYRNRIYLPTLNPLD